MIDWRETLIFLEQIRDIDASRRIDYLRKFLIEQLNFDYVDEILDIEFPKGIQDKVIQTKVISQKGDFKIILCKVENLLKGTEFPAIQGISKYYLNNLVVFTDKELSEFHFVNTKYVGKDKRVRGFRRISLGKTDRLRTAAERLSLIYASSGISTLELQSKCEQAFDVEAVSKDFYKEFVKNYKDLKIGIRNRNKLSEEEADKVTQDILNRLLFLYFLQKKGWLNDDYKFLYNNFLSLKEDGKEYYKTFLLPLFKKLAIYDYKYRGFENIPFLNGGLFEFKNIEEKINISNDSFAGIFGDLLERFNFTIREDTEYEEEVAVDPEMLGKIFENLILGIESGEYKDIPDVRRISGSYYTPRFVVSFMVKESLLNYLVTEFPDIPRYKMKSLVFAQQVKNIDDIKLKNIKDKLLDLKIVDPGIGSGAFAVDILNNLVRLIKKLDSIIDKSDKRYSNHYELRKYLIENTIYGVDIQKRAIHLAHLRLWLSLIVDMEARDIKDIPPLINLDFKVLEGDSLVSKIFGYPFDMSKINTVGRKTPESIMETIEKFRKIKKDFAETYDELKKKKLKENIEKKKREIALWHLNQVKKQKSKELIVMEGQQELFKKEKQQNLFEKSEQEKEKIKKEINEIESKIAKIRDGEKIDAFNWYLDFFEVMGTKDGFDIVIGNPPYGSGDIRKEVYKDEFGLATKESYGVFTALALNILNTNGTLCFIMSDTWQSIRTHRKLREKLLDGTEVQYLISVPSKTFKTRVYPGIYMFRKTDGSRRLQSANDFILAADFHNLDIKNGDLEAGFDMLMEEDTFDETKDGDSIVSDREMAIYAYRQKLIKRFSNLSFFIASPKLFKLMDDMTNVEMFKRPPVIKVDFNDKEIELVKLGNIADVKQGLATADNDYYLRQFPGTKGSKYKEIDLSLVLTGKDFEKIREDEKLRKDVIENGFCTNPSHKTYTHRYFEGRYFVPYDKGGASDIEEGWLPNYYVPTPYFIDWSEQAVRRLKTYKKPSKNKIASRFQNTDFYFKEGITWSLGGFYSPSFRLSSFGVFDVMGSRVILRRQIKPEYILGILNSKLGKFLLKNYINHSIILQIEELKRFPILNPERGNNKQVSTLVKEIFDKQKSIVNYDFITNEQIEIDKIVYDMYNLNGDDIKEVEDWYHKRYPKLAKVIEEKLKNKNKGG